MQPWIEEELLTSDFGDERLDNRFRKVMDHFSDKPSVSVPAACGTWAETMGAYRFFDNERVGLDDVMAPHEDATLERIAQQDVALLVQDTTELDVTRREEEMDGAGPLNDESRVGFFNHPMLAFTPEQIPLGHVKTHVWARDLDEFRENQKDKDAKEKKRKQRPIEEKESFRWLEGYWRGCEIAEEIPETTIVVISDSEGDIFECMSEGQPEKGVKKAEWIIRAGQDRSLSNGNEDGRLQRLWDEVSSTEVLGTMEIQVSKNRGKSSDSSKRNQSRSARSANMTIRATRVTLKGPQRPGGRPSNIGVNAILVRETDPPADEDPVEWLLLTSLPINTFKKICVVIDYYCCRWQIEVYFRTLKSGCAVEKLQLETADRFLPCLGTYMIVAWRVMYALMLGRECPEMPCDAVFSESEWKAVYTVVQEETPPEQSPTLGEMVYMIASLGGHLGRTHDGPPGPKAMWIGMQRATDLALAWRTFGPRNTAARATKPKRCV